ncbi:MAG TPA: hypothetical protein VK171_03695, partial [Fimbriimonas sp.]|nr:hypothetical protein [Fimbriimonas sp.]
AGGNSGIPFLQGMNRTFDRYKLATQKTHMFMFKFGKAASYFTTLYDVSVDHSKSYTKDQLPEKMRERMDRLSKSRQEIEKQQQQDIPPL